MAAFLATGRRAVLIGENSLWASWNATLWGSSLNTLTILDANLQDDTYGNGPDNPRFNANTATWLASSTVVATPEPASLILVATGFVGIIAVARRRRSA